MKRYKIPVYLLFLVLLNLAFLINSEATPKIQKLIISPLNRVSIYFNELPVQYSSELSSDKSQINIKFKNTSAPDEFREMHGEGIIKDIYAQNIKGILTLNIILRDKRGYTIEPLPFTRTLIIDVFDWKKLNPSDDNFREGLLALEGGSFSSAKRYFITAANSGNPAAMAQLGYLLLTQGRFHESAQRLLSAEKSGFHTPDVFAALAQVYNKLGDKPNYEFYKKQFATKTNGAIPPEIVINDKIIDNSEEPEPFSLLKDINEPATNPQDSLAAIQKSDSIRRARNSDSIMKARAAELSAKSKKVNNIQNEQSKSSDWFSSIFVYAALIIGVILLILVSSYVKWRKQQISKLKKINKPIKKNIPTATNQETVKPSIPGGKTVADIYKKNELERKSNKPEENQSTVNEQQKEEQHKLAASLERLAREIISSKAEEAKANENQANIIQRNLSRQQIKAPVTAKLELAFHLQQEQQKLKSKTIEDLRNEDFSVDYNKLSETAKKLGLEKNSLETKKNIAEISYNKDNLMKLADKFSVNNEKSDE